MIKLDLFEIIMSVIIGWAGWRVWKAKGKEWLDALGYKENKKE